MYWLPYSSHTSHPPSQTPCLPSMSYFTQKLMLDSCKMLQNSLKHSIRFCGIFSKFKTEFYCISFLWSFRLDFLKIHQLWQSGLVRVYSDSCFSCSFEPEIIRIGFSSHKMYSNNIPNFQESMTIINAHAKKVWKLIVCTSYQSLCVI